MQLATGPPLLLEVTTAPAGVDGVVETGLGDRVKAGAEWVSGSLEDSVKGAAQMLANAAFAVDPAPSEVEVTFGVKAAGEVGSIVVGRGTAEANFVVRCVWRRELAPPG